MVSFAAACSSGDPELLVDVTSDLAAVTELTSVEVSLSRGTTLVTGVDYAFVPVDDLRAGVRVAELRAPSDDYVLRVRAFDPAGALIAEHVRDVRLVSRFGVSVYIDGACVGIECPGDGDPRTFTACMAGSCVPPACLDDPTLCDVDAGFDAGTDVGVDAPIDAGIDVGPDAPDAMADASIDVSPTCTLPDLAGTYTIASIPEVRIADGLEVVEGADIDLRTSDTSDVLGCQIPDFDDPDGTRGIDNQLASLKPTLDGFVDVDEAFLAADVSFQLRTEMEAGCDVVVLTSGDTEYRAVASVSGAILRARFGPSSAMQFPSLDPTTPWTLRNVQLRYDLMERAAWIAGSLDIDDVVAGFVAVAEVPEDVLRTTLESIADLEPDSAGSCVSISAGVEAR